LELGVEGNVEFLGHVRVDAERHGTGATALQAFVAKEAIGNAAKSAVVAIELDPAASVLKDHRAGDARADGGRRLTIRRPRFHGGEQQCEGEPRKEAEEGFH
jgi:hypothetical protein